MTSLAMKASAPLSSVIARLASAIALLALWQVASAASAAIPAPGAVLSVLWSEAMHGPLLAHLAATALRVAAALALSLVSGFALGLAMGRNETVDRLAGPWLSLLLNAPALVVMVLAYIVLGLNDVALVVAVAIDKLAYFAVAIRDGARALDAQYDDLARVYRFGAVSRFHHVVMPQLLPLTLSATRNGLAMIWKLVLVAEFLGRSDGVGFVIQTSFQLFDVPRLVAYALSFMVLSAAVDALLLTPAERRLLDWRA